MLVSITNCAFPLALNTLYSQAQFTRTSVFAFQCSSRAPYLFSFILQQNFTMSSEEYAKSQYQEMISESQLSGVVYSMIILASLFVLARSGVQVCMRRKLEAQDFLLYAAFILFLATTICYLVIFSKVFMIARVSVGVLEPGPTFQADMITYVRMMFVTTTLFWISLWLVKLSFLSLYRKLLEGLPIVYMRLWSAVLVFCVIVSLIDLEPRTPTHRIS